MSKYKITTLFAVSQNWDTFLSTVFPAFNGEPCLFEDGIITVTFATPQTPADLGPLVKVELLQPSDSP